MSAATDADAPNPKHAKIAFGVMGAVVGAMGLIGGALVAIVVLLALLGTPLFAIMGGASELAWLTHKDPEQQFLRRLASEVFGSRFAGSPILTTIPLFTFVGYLMAESKTPERLVRLTGLAGTPREPAPCALAARGPDEVTAVVEGRLCCRES